MAPPEDSEAMAMEADTVHIRRIVPSYRADVSRRRTDVSYMRTAVSHRRTDVSCRTDVPSYMHIVSFHCHGTESAEPCQGPRFSDILRRSFGDDDEPGAVDAAATVL